MCLHKSVINYFTPHPPDTSHIHTSVSGLQNPGPMPARFHLEFEHFQFCDASGPECLPADPGQCHPLFWGNPSPQILFYSGGNAVNEEGYWEGEQGRGWNGNKSLEDLEAQVQALVSLHAD